MPSNSTVDPGACTEREITHPVTLCRADGTLNPQAVGWSRVPLHDCTLNGWGRNKRWDYWCVTADTHVLAITYSSIDFVAILNVWFLDLETLDASTIEMATPASVGVKLPDSVGGDMSFRGPGLTMAITEEPEGTRLVARGRARGGDRIEVDVVVALPDGHETLSVVIPWSQRRFQFTSKHNTRPASGTVVVGGKGYRFGADNNSFGCLDFGRGRWPHRVLWNWGAASGLSGGHVVGLQFGGKWTSGTGLTENALCVDGRLHMISEELIWVYDPTDWTGEWQVSTPRSDRVDLTFRPFYEKRAKASIGVLGTETHQCFGHWTGTVVTDDGTAVPVEGILGWAEEVHMTW